MVTDDADGAGKISREISASTCVVVCRRLKVHLERLMTSIGGIHVTLGSTARRETWARRFRGQFAEKLKKNAS